MINKYDAATKVIKVIESCKTLDHLKVALRMVLLFRKSCKDNDLFSMMSVKLTTHRLVSHLKCFTEVREYITHGFVSVKVGQS